MGILFQGFRVYRHCDYVTRVGSKKQPIGTSSETYLAGKDNIMKFYEAYLNEELKFNTKNEALNKLFRSRLPAVYSSAYLKKIDDVFDRNIKIKEFEKTSNIMAYTKGTEIYISDKIYDIPNDQAVIYLLHELVHALSNTSKFNDLVQLNIKLSKLIEKNISKNNINKFLTGKDQDIHSNYKDEIVSYLMNNSLQWNMVDKKFIKEFIDIVFSSGIFNAKSSFWLKRFPDIKL